MLEPMRLARPVVALLALLACAGPAAAQTPPPDERAAAQAFADAAERFETRIDALGKVETKWAERCGSLLAKVPVERQDAAIAIAMAHGVRKAVAPMKPALRDFRTELANVPTLDPALISGRAAVRKMGRVWDAVPAPHNLCVQLRKWRGNGYPKRAGRAAEREVEKFFGVLQGQALRRLEAAAARMRELGVSAEDAAHFGGGGSGSTW
jgi:hypothetical protein